MKIRTINSLYGANCIPNYKRINKPVKNVVQQNQETFSKFKGYSLYDNNGDKSVSFKGTPYILYRRPVLTARQAIQQYDYLRLGNYSDSHDDKYNPKNKEIRLYNYGFLDELSYSQKPDFIDYYKELTGFPDLQLVSQKIEDEFKKAIHKTEGNLHGDEYRCISAGYDDTCSVGKGYALPGSDLDKAYIILKGGSSEKEDKKIVEKFSGELWENTDQRLLSYNHDTSFPTIMTEGQVRRMMEKINAKTYALCSPYYEYEDLVKYEYRDLERAARFNEEISTYFDTYRHSDNITKEDVKNFGFFIEPYRDGKEVIKSKDSDKLREDIKDSRFYRFSNVAQIRAMKNAIYNGKEQKEKIRKRIELQQEFDKWPVNKQYNFIKEVIKYASEDQENFKEYFSNDYDIKSKYKPLLGKLTYGDRSLYYIPEFEPYYDGYNMKYGDYQNVKLYPGRTKNILWIDSNDGNTIRRVLADMDKIRCTEKFKHIDRIQYEEGDFYSYYAYPTDTYSARGLQIYEMMLDDEDK